MQRETIGESFSLAQSKQHSSGMHPLEALTWIRKHLDLDNRYFNLADIRKISEQADRLWLAGETGIRQDLRKEIKTKQIVIVSMMKNCARATGRKLYDNLIVTATQVMVLSRLESRWKTESSKTGMTYEGKERLKLIIE